MKNTENGGWAKFRARFVLMVALLVIVLIIAVVALIMSLADIELEALAFSLDKGATIIGILVSTVGLVVTGYFVVLAINAYSHVREIEDLAQKTNSYEQSINLFKDRMGEILDCYSSYLFEDLSERISSVGMVPSGEQSMKDEKLNLRKKRARLVLKLPEIKEDLFRKLVLELGEIGDKQDLDNLKSLRYGFSDVNRRDLVDFVIDYMNLRLSGDNTTN